MRHHIKVSIAAIYHINDSIKNQSLLEVSSKEREQDQIVYVTTRIIKYNLNQHHNLSNRGGGKPIFNSSYINQYNSQ